VPGSKFHIVELKVDQEKIVGTVLRALPQYFRQESAIVDYCHNSKLPQYKTFASLTDGGNQVGFAMLVMNNSMTAEIWVMGVVPDFHGQGAGSLLLGRLEEESLKAGRNYLMAKTIGPSQNDPNYQKTVAFYIKNGFTMLVEWDFIWKDDYCALMVKPLKRLAIPAA